MSDFKRIREIDQTGLHIETVEKDLLEPVKEAISDAVGEGLQGGREERAMATATISGIALAMIKGFCHAYVVLKRLDPKVAERLHEYAGKDLEAAKTATCDIIILGTEKGKEKN